MKNQILNKYILFKIKPLLTLHLVFLILFCVPVSASTDNGSRIFTVKTQAGSYPLTIPALRLPKYAGIPLAEVQHETLPELSDWFYPHFVPEDPSWLDSAGKFYKEGVVSLFQGDADLALRRFKKVTDEYQDTPWFAPSWFWQGQILVKKNKYDLASKTLTQFLFVLEYTKSQDRYIDYQNITLYTLAWLELKQKKPDAALILIERDERRINDTKIRSHYHFLKFWTLIQLSRKDEAYEVLKQAIPEFPAIFQHVIRLAEHYHRSQNWTELSKLVKKHGQDPQFFNHESIEYFLRLGVEASISLKKWDDAQQMLKWIEDIGIRNPDKQEMAYMRIHLHTGQFKEAWKRWLEIDDDKIREWALREIFHQSIKQKKYEFVIIREFDDDYWESWQGEGQLILAYANLQLDKQQKAIDWLEEAFEQSRSVNGDDTSVVQEESLRIKATIDLISGKLDSALTNIQTLLENHADSNRLSDYYFWYGVTLYEQVQNPMPVMMAMRQVAEAGPRDDDRWFLVGKVNFEQKKWQPAIQALKQLETKHPDSPFLEEGYLLLAQAFHEQKQNKQAYQSIVELRKKYEPLKNPVLSITLQVHILMAMEKYEQADELLKNDLEKYPDFKLIRLRVELLKKLDDPGRILDVTGLGLGLSTSKDQGFLYFHRANALFDTKDFESAFTYYNLAFKNPPEGQDRYIRFQILQTRYQLNRYPDFLQGTTPFLKENNDDDFANTILSLASQYHLQNNQHKQAKPFLKQLIANHEKKVRQPELEPDKRLELIVQIGMLYNQLKEYDSAVTWFNQALKSMKEVEGAKKRWQLVILREQGFALYKLGKHRNALAANLKVSYLDRKLPADVKYKLNLRIASSYVELKRFKEAKAVYRKMLKKFKEKDQQTAIMKLLNQLN